MRKAERALQTEEDERDGFVVIWFALLIVVLLGIAAVAVDLVHAYQEQQHAQAAADAAALAGAVEIPTDTSAAHTNAVTRATSVARENYGFTGAGDTVTPVADPSIPNQLDVTVTRRFSTFFGSILGFGNLTVRRTAQAQYDPPASMGSAVNHIGDVPVCPDMTTAPGSCSTDVTPGAWIQKLWASIQGPLSDKQSGNAFTTGVCDVPANPLMVDGCANGNNAANNENHGQGETFQLKLPTAGAYDVWVYDPSFVNTNPSCGAAPFANTFANDWTASANPTYHAVGTNYTNTDFCPGDTYGIPPLVGAPMETDFEVFDPADSAGNRAPTGTCATTRQLDGGVQAGNVVKFQGWAKNADVPASIKADLDGSGAPVANAAAALDWENKSGGVQKSYFHQWYRLCTITTGAPTVDGNEYQMQVTTPSGLGTNQFAVQVLPHGSMVGVTGTSVFARQSLPLVAVNFNSGVTSNFYLARILPSSRDRILQLSFFDLGDSSTPGVKTGNLQISTLGVSNGNLSCTYVPPPTNSTSPRTSPVETPFPQASFVAAPGCTVAYDAASATATWNGRWISVDITIKKSTDALNGYRCDPTVLSNCWIQLGYTPNPGASLSDATTWDAQLVGSPVRLVG